MPKNVTIIGVKNKKNMLLLWTDSLKGYGLNRVFELAQAAGFDGVDLAVNHSNYDTFNTEYIKSLSKKYSLPVHSISAPDDSSADQIKHVVKMAKELKSKVVILQAPKITNVKLAGFLKKEIPKLREKEFLSIALENAPAGTFLFLFPERAMSGSTDLKKFKHISMDTARIGEKNTDLMRAYSSFKKYLVHVHLSNVHKGKKYSMPDEGIMPLESFLTKLKQEKYPGAISLKVFPSHLKAGEDDEKVLDELAKAKKFLDKYYTNVK